MYFSPFQRVTFPCGQLNGFFKSSAMQISVLTAQSLIVHVSSHVLDDIRTNVVDLVDAIDFYESCSPDLRKVNFLQIRKIANHVVVYRTSVVFVLELDNCHVLEVRVSISHPQNEVFEVAVTGLNILDVKGHLVIERECHELRAAVEVTAHQLPNTVSSCALTVLVIML